MIGGMVEMCFVMGFVVYMVVGLNFFRLDFIKIYVLFCNCLSIEVENFLDFKFFFNLYFIVDEWKVGC